MVPMSSRISSSVWTGFGTKPRPDAAGCPVHASEEQVRTFDVERGIRNATHDLVDGDLHVFEFHDGRQVEGLGKRCVRTSPRGAAGWMMVVAEMFATKGG